MAITIRNIDPNVPYAGKTFPADAVKFQPQPADPNVPYNGATYPGAAVKFTPLVPDQSNNPSFVLLGTLQSVANSDVAGLNTTTPFVTGLVLSNGGIVLPGDAKVKFDVSNILARTTIIDGVEVVEHIRRAAINIEIEFTIRAKNNQEWIFGQNFLDSLMQNIVYPASVIYVQNTLLNKIGVSQMILDKTSVETIRGNINMPTVLKFIENIPGASLIIPIPTS